MSSRRPRSLLLALALTAAVLGCGDDDPDVDAQASTTTALASPTTTDGETTTTTPATTAAPSPTVAPTTGGPEDPPACDEGETLTADVDGDGADDTIALISDPAAFTSVLRACTASGVLELDALGATTVDTADIDRDGAAEIIYGGTSAMARTVQIARFVDGTLVTITVGGGPLMLVDGYPDGTPPDGPRHAFGCTDNLGGTPVHLVALEVMPINPSEFIFTLEATGYLLDGAAATAVDGGGNVSPGAGSPGGTAEELMAYADELVAEHAPAC